jgi:hypothetical protein
MNKGTGAGGSNTNLYGKQFEDKTNNSERLIKMGYKRHDCYVTKGKIKLDYYYLSRVFDKTIYFVIQNGLKKFMKAKYNIDIFRCPDEAYIIDGNRKIIIILEKKEQNVEGSVETKLWSGPSLKREYELVLGNEFIVSYSFCVNNFLKDSSLRITPDEQLGLIKKLYFNQLPFQKRSQDIYKQMILKENNTSYKLSYVYGSAVNTSAVNWILGYVEENKHPYFFVMYVVDQNIQPKNNEANTVAVLKSILTQQGFLKGLR